MFFIIPPRTLLSPSSLPRLLKRLCPKPLVKSSPWGLPGVGRVGRVVQTKARKFFFGVGIVSLGGPSVVITAGILALLLSVYSSIVLASCSCP